MARAMVPWVSRVGFLIDFMALVDWWIKALILQTKSLRVKGKLMVAGADLG